MKTLSKRIGETIAVVIPFINETQFQHVKLHAVEVGGIWIESPVATQKLLNDLKLQVGKTPVVFVPYAQIRYILDALDEISLSEKAFGV